MLCVHTNALVVVITCIDAGGMAWAVLIFRFIIAVTNVAPPRDLYYRA